MVATLRHEPFYHVGTWTDPSIGVYVGWSSRKGSFPGAMPLHRADGTASVVFSGEDFSEAGAEQCASSILKTAVDPAFPAQLNGRFHGIVIDHHEHTATVFVDRYGMHRLYYHESAETFTFAAEAKAILAAHAYARQLEPQSVGEFLACGCVLENRSLFRGVRLMPPASKWSCAPGRRLVKSTYFEPREWEEQTPLPADEYYTALRDVFAARLPRYFRGPER